MTILLKEQALHWLKLSTNWQTEDLTVRAIRSWNEARTLTKEERDRLIEFQYIEQHNKGFPWRPTQAGREAGLK